MGIQSPATGHPLQLIQLPNKIGAALLLSVKRLSGWNVNTRGPHERGNAPSGVASSHRKASMRSRSQIVGYPISASREDTKRDRFFRDASCKRELTPIG